MSAGPVFTFISLFVLISSAVAIPTGCTAAARRNDHVTTARDNGAQFYLEDNYQAENFFDGFNFYSDADPTHGLVDYVDRDEAFARNLTFINENGQAVMRVDKDTYLQPGEFRKSVRLHSKKRYGNGLIVIDLATMPHGCSVWPSFWMLSGEQQWPNGGEIDIIEGVNEPGGNSMTLHTAAGCTLDVSNNTRSQFTGSVSATNCDANVNGNAGCGIVDSDPLSYGHEFNVNDGGVFATLLDDSGIRIWRFGRHEVPADINSGNPNPNSWAAPKAFWSASTCSRSFIDDQQELVFTTTLCGDWAGSVFNQMGCGGTCSDFIRDPANFVWARWIINSIKVYKHT